MLALIGNLNVLEILVIAAAALMLFGNRLPEVAMRGAAQFIKLRRAVLKMWREAGLEEELRRVQREVTAEVPKFKAPHLAVKEASRRYLRDLEKEIDEAGEEKPREVTPETVEAPKNNPALEAARRVPEPGPKPAQQEPLTAPAYAPRPVTQEVISPDDRREDRPRGEAPAETADDDGQGRKTGDAPEGGGAEVESELEDKP